MRYLDRPDLITLYFLGFSGYIDFTIIGPSVLKYIQEIVGENEEAQTYLAVSSALFAAAQLVSPVLAGWGSNRPNGLKMGFYGLLSAAILGNILYSMAILFDSVIALCIGRFIAGWGTGTIGLAMSYIGATTSKEERVRVIADFRAVTGVGAMVSQAVAYGLTFVEFNWGKWRIDEYSGPGLFTAVLLGLSWAGIVLYVRDPKAERTFPEADVKPREVDVAPSHTSSKYESLPRSSSSSSITGDVESQPQATKDGIPAQGEKPGRFWTPGTIVCLIIFLYNGILTSGITQFWVTVTAQDGWGWTTADLSHVFLGSYVMLFLGSLHPRWSNHFNIVQNHGEWISISFHLVLVLAGIIFMAIGVLDGFAETGDARETLANADEWRQWIFCIGFIVLYFGYAAENVVAGALYSKIIPPRFMVTMMPLYVSAFAVGNIIGPLWSRAAVGWGGWSLVYGVMVVFTTALLLAIITCRNHLKARKVEGEDATQPLMAE